MNHSWKYQALIVMFVGVAAVLGLTAAMTLAAPAPTEAVVVSPTAAHSAAAAEPSQAAEPTASPTAVIQPVGRAVDRPSARASATPRAPEPARSVTIRTVEGEVSLQRSESDAAQAAAAGDELSPGDTIITGPESEALLELDDGTLMAVFENSTLTLDTLDGTPRSAVTRFLLSIGDIFAGREGRLPDGAAFEILAPHSVAAIRGSAMRVVVTGPAEPVRMACLEGHCYAQEQGEPVDVVGGQAVTMRIGGYWALGGLWQTDLAAWDAAFELIEQAGLELNIEPVTSLPSSASLTGEDANGVLVILPASSGHAPGSDADDQAAAPPSSEESSSSGDAPGGASDTPGGEQAAAAPGEWADTPAGGAPPPGQTKDK